jgi:Ca2+-binding EF-hand superfamily protein
VYKAEFDKFDSSKDGAIDITEFGQMLRGLGPLAALFCSSSTDNISDAEVAALFRKADINGDGAINFDEFLALREQGMVKAEFDKLDTGGRGFIHVKEFGEMLRILGPDSALFRIADSDGSGDLSDAEIAALIKKADRNGDGSISFDEFVNALGGGVTAVRSRAGIVNPAFARQKGFGGSIFDRCGRFRSLLEFAVENDPEGADVLRAECEAFEACVRKVPNFASLTPEQMRRTIDNAGQCTLSLLSLCVTHECRAQGMRRGRVAAARGRDEQCYALHSRWKCRGYFCGQGPHRRCVPRQHRRPPQVHPRAPMTYHPHLSIALMPPSYIYQRPRNASVYSAKDSRSCTLSRAMTLISLVASSLTFALALLYYQFCILDSDQVRSHLQVSYLECSTFPKHCAQISAGCF